MNTKRAAHLAAETEDSMGRMKDLHALRYEHTHHSRIDGSPAMMVSADPFILMNEDGYEWADDPGDWAPIQRCSL